MSNPRKRKAFSVEEKLKLCKKFDDEAHLKTQKQFAEEQGLAVSTFRTILKDRTRYAEVASTSVNSSRHKLRSGHFEELETILLEWFQQARAANLPISGPILKEKAEEIAGRLAIDEFAASSGWLDRFKNRHGIVYRQICGEAESVKPDDVELWWSTTLPTLLKDYPLENVYNADEFGLFFKLLPDKSLVFKKESCHGGKLSKERVTVLACANATGTHKLRLLVIGKSRSPCCFKNVKSFPVDYVSQSRAWMTAELFSNWLKKLDQYFAKKNKKVLLFVDNCPAHPKDVELEFLKVVFFPPNATSRLQPLDQGIIKVLKQAYRKKLVRRYVAEMDESIQQQRKVSLTILDTMHYISTAWSEMKPDVIKNCFR